MCHVGPEFRAWNSKIIEKLGLDVFNLVLVRKRVLVNRSMFSTKSFKGHSLNFDPKQNVNEITHHHKNV